MLRYLSDNPIQDRDIYIRGKTPAKVGAVDSKRLIFRNMMIEDKDLEIADVIWNYFSAVRTRWPAAWDKMCIRDRPGRSISVLRRRCG